MRKEVWFGLSIMALVVIGVFWILPPPSQMTNGHLGLLMLAMIVVAIMLGFPTAFTLMGMGTMFTFFFYYSQNPGIALVRTLDLMVQRAFAVMNNDVLISVPLFVFMGYLVERANLIEKLFKSLHLATTRIPGSLAVATISTWPAGSTTSPTRTSSSSSVAMDATRPFISTTLIDPSPPGVFATSSRSTASRWSSRTPRAPRRRRK